MVHEKCSAAARIAAIGWKPDASCARIPHRSPCARRSGYIRNVVAQRPARIRPELSTPPDRLEEGRDRQPVNAAAITSVRSHIRREFHPGPYPAQNPSTRFRSAANYAYKGTCRRGEPY